LDEDDIASPATRALASLQQRIREAINVDALQPRKALITAHVQEVEIRSRSEIYPTFRVPGRRGHGRKGSNAVQSRAPVGKR
jgi:hypothetical protein